MTDELMSLEEIAYFEVWFPTSDLKPLSNEDERKLQRLILTARTAHKLKQRVEELESELRAIMGTV